MSRVFHSGLHAGGALHLPPRKARKTAHRTYCTMRGPISYTLSKFNPKLLLHTYKRYDSLHWKSLHRYLHV